MIAGLASCYGVVCNDDQHIIAAGAFTKLVNRGFAPKMLFGHQGEEIGRWLRISEVEAGLFVVGQLVDRHAIEEVESGRCRGLSLGDLVGVRRPIERGLSLCVEVLDLPEISIVHQPGNPGALMEAICTGAG